MTTKELLVSAIKNGTVIDHIASGQALKILQLLQLTTHKKILTLGFNLPSRLMDRKDLIKIEDKELRPEETHEVALLAPQATINIVRNYKVIKKFAVVLPKMVERIIVCPNPKCITNNEQMESVFFVEANRGINLKCKYCEKVFPEKEIKSYNL